MNTRKERLVVVVFSSEQLTFATFQTLTSEFKDKDELHLKLKETNYVGELVKLIDAADVEYIWTEESMSTDKAEIKEKEVYGQFLKKRYIYLGTKFKEKTTPLIDGFTSNKPTQEDSNQKNELDKAINLACREGDSKTISDNYPHVMSDVKKGTLWGLSKPKILLLSTMIIFFFWALIIASNNTNTSSKVTTKSTSKKVTTKPNYTVTTGFKNKAKALIIASGFRCQTIDSIIEHNFSYGYSVVCNNYRYNYEIKDVGGNWIVEVD